MEPSTLWSAFLHVESVGLEVMDVYGRKREALVVSTVKAYKTWALDTFRTLAESIAKDHKGVVRNYIRALLETWKADKPADEQPTLQNVESRLSHMKDAARIIVAWSKRDGDNPVVFADLVAVRKALKGNKNRKAKSTTIASAVESDGADDSTGRKPIASTTHADNAGKKIDGYGSLVDALKVLFRSVRASNPSISFAQCKQAASAAVSALENESADIAATSESERKRLSVTAPKPNSSNRKRPSKRAVTIGDAMQGVDENGSSYASATIADVEEGIQKLARVG
jgi:hypothetical protein